MAPRNATPTPARSGVGDRFDPRTIAAAANEIRTPLGIVALVVLVCASVLGAQTVRGGSDALTIGMLVLLLVALVGGVVLALAAGRQSDGGSNTPGLRAPGMQRTFMSAPMASLTGDDYLRMKQKMRAIREALKRDAGQAEVFWGGDSVDDPGHFDRPGEALSLTIRLIRECDNFILVLPDYACAPRADGYCKPSSIWWEAGIAVALGKRCTFFLHRQFDSDERMPYYVRAMRTSQGDGVPPSKTWLFNDVRDIERDIRDSRENIFTQSPEALARQLP